MKKKIKQRKRTSAIRIGKQGKKLDLMDMKIRQAFPDKQKRLEYVQALGKYFDDIIPDN